MAVSACRDLAIRYLAPSSALTQVSSLLGLTKDYIAQCGSIPVTLTHVGTQLHQTRQARRVRVILTKDHPKLGNKGDEVSVRAGYARNMLHPAQQAIYASGGKLARQVEEEDSKSDNAEAQLERLLDKLAAGKLVTKRRLNWRHREEERMIGVVNTKHVQEMVLRQLSIELPRELVLMQRPIEAFGEYRIPLNLKTREGKQIELNLTVLKTLRIHGP